MIRELCFKKMVATNNFLTSMVACSKHIRRNRIHTNKNYSLHYVQNKNTNNFVVVVAAIYFGVTPRCAVPVTNRLLVINLQDVA